MALFSKFAVTVLRAGLREVRALRRTLEVGIDSYREAHSMPPVFQAQEAPPTFTRDRDRVIGHGEFLSLWLIEELCREQRIPLDENSDLEMIAKEHGWITPDGKFTMLPASASLVDGQEIQVVVGQT